MSGIGAQCEKTVPEFQPSLFRGYMYLYNLVYSVSGKRSVGLLYAVSEVDALSRLKLRFPGQKVEILGYWVVSRSAS